MESLIQCLRASARNFPETDAIIVDDGSLTFTEFNHLSDRAAAGLIERGIKKADRVALYCINSAEFAIAYAGILKAGGTVVPVNVLLNSAEIEFILEDAGVKAILYHQCLEETVCKFRDQLRLDFSVSIFSAGNESVSWDQLLSAEAQKVSVQIDPEVDLAAILYTSGTTGRPKGAMLSHSNLVSNTRSVSLALEIRPGVDRIFVVLPMFHAFAATVGMLTPLTSGCAFVPAAKFDPQAVAQSIERTGSTIFLGVPSMYSVLSRLRDDRIEMFRSLRLCISGGAALPVEILESFEQKFGVRIHEGDGPTECSPVTCLNPVHGPGKPGSVGLPVADVEMKIVNDDGDELRSGEVGEIAVRGPNVMRGYLHLPEETAAVMRDGWFLTGDLGCIDEDGYFSIVDRKKDLVIVNGMNVYPRMVEEVIHRLRGVVEVAVIGEAHKTHGEIPVAYIVVDESVGITESDIRAWCIDYLGSHQVPRKFNLLDSLPKNATGKIIKRELSKRGEIERGIQSGDTWSIQKKSS